jgi:hypothetical protein
VRSLFGTGVLLLCGLSAARGQVTSESLQAAQERFTNDITQAESGLRARFDAALKSAKTPAERNQIAAERELFENAKIPPKSIAAKEYVRQRDQAVQKVTTTYQSLIAKQRAEQPLAEDADALELELAGLLIRSRGYGLALPDPDAGTPVRIVNTSNGLAFDLRDPGDATIPPTLAKPTRGRAAQLWRVERDGTAFRLKNTGSGQYLSLTGATGSSPVRVGTGPAPPVDAAEPVRWEFVEMGRRVLIRNVGQPMVLAAVPVKKDGAVTWTVQPESRNEQSTTQTWLLTPDAR